MVAKRWLSITANSLEKIMTAIFFRSYLRFFRWLRPPNNVHPTSCFCCLLLFLSLLGVLGFIGAKWREMREINVRNAELLAVPPRNSSPDAASGYPSKQIILWTSWFGNKAWLDMVSLASDGLLLYVRNSNQSDTPTMTCLVSNNRSKLPIADALLFHALDVKPVDMPPMRENWQRWIYFNMEPPPHLQAIDWNFMSTVGFNWTMGYSEATDIFIPYWRLAMLHGTVSLDPEFILNVGKRIEIFVEGFSKRRADAIWIVSNCRTVGYREAIVKQLVNLGLTIDVFGRCTSSDVENVINEIGEYKLMSNYRYYLSFENSVCDNYTSEKSERGFLLNQRHGLIPIVYGGANYKMMMPPDSYINLLDFKSLPEAASYLRFLSQPSSKINVTKYFLWHYQYVSMGTPFLLDAMMSICDKLWSPLEPPRSHSTLTATLFGRCSELSEAWLQEKMDTIYFYSFFTPLQNLRIFIVRHTFFFVLFIVVALICATRLGLLLYFRHRTRK